MFVDKAKQPILNSEDMVDNYMYDRDTFGDHPCPGPQDIQDPPREIKRHIGCNVVVSIRKKNVDIRYVMIF
jgi:hypothetical protein